MITKEDVIKAASEVIATKQHDLKSALSDLESALKNDSKSSAGDKHETSRAMTHLEQEKLASQLTMLQSQKKALESNSSSGVFLETSKGVFYIGVALGKLTVNGTDVFCISATSPLGKAFLHALPKEKVTVNGIEYLITHRS